MAQLIISVAGAAAGFALGGPQGAQIGWAAGSVLGAAFAPAQKQSGPKITDGKITGTEYGQPLRYIDGVDRHAGQLVWASKVRPIKNTTSTGGKGGGVKSTTYTYQVDLLYIVADVEIAGVPRCWVNGKLVRNLLATADAATLQASTQSEYWSDFLVYPGTYTQLPDPTYEADKGVGSTPALRGRGYVLLKDFELGTSITIPNISFEVATGLTPGMQDDESLAWTAQTVGYMSTPSHRQAGFSIETYAYPSLIANTYRVTPGGKLRLTSSRSFSSYYSAGYDQVVGVADIDCVVWDLPDHDGFLLERIGGGLSASFISPAVGLGVPGSHALAIRGNDMVITLGVAGGHLARFNLAGGPAVASAIGYGGGSHGLEIVGDKLYWIASSAGPVKEFDLATMAFIRNLPALGTSIDYIFSSDVGELYAVNGDFIYAFDGTSWAVPVGGSAHISIAGAAGAPGATMVGNVLYNHSIGAGSTLEMWAITINPTMVPTTSTLSDVVSRLCLRAGLTAGQFDVSGLPALSISGFGLGQVTTTRQALEMLAQAGFFSCRLSDKLYFFPTFGTSVATLPFIDLGASPGGDAPPLQIKTLSDVEKPTHVALSYSNIDAAYNTGTAYPNGRLSTQDSTSTTALPLVMTSAEAQAIVDTTQQDSVAWIFSTQISLTHQYARLEPGDVVNAQDRSGNVYTLRLGKRVEAGGVITFEARSHDASVIVTAGLGGGTYSAPGEVRALPYTDAEYMDIPLLQDADDGVPVLYAAAKGTGAGWPGAAIYGGFDASNLEQASIATTASVFGVTTTALADWTRGNVIDEVATLDVDVGTGELVSVTADQMLDSQANAVLVGNEVVQFRDRTLLSPGKYRVGPGLLRGRLGTEWAQTGHSVGERFVMLTPDALRRIALTTTQLDAERTYRAVTLGRALSTGDDALVTCTGVSLKPWAPVSPRVTRPVASGPSILLHMDGTNGSTTFTDSSINALNFTAAGNAQISTAQAVFGGASYLGDGTGDYISRAHNTVFDVATGDFTVACRVRPNSVGAQQIIAIKQLASGNGTFILYLSAAGFLKFGASNTSGVLIVDLTAAAAVTPGTWYHLVGVREGNVFRLYIDGVQQASATNSSSLQSNATHPLVVGGFSNGTQSFDGHIDEFALWKGLAVYPGGTTFTPEAAAYPNPGAGTGNVTVEWDRRTRLRTNPTNGYVPVGEATESYEVVVYTTSGYVTPVRTITGLTSSSWEYTRDQQIADFGSQQATVYADIFQISAVVGRGYPLRGAF